MNNNGTFSIHRLDHCLREVNITTATTAANDLSSGPALSSGPPPKPIVKAECPSCWPFIHGRVEGVIHVPTGGSTCFTTCQVLNITGGAAYFLTDNDVKKAKHRLSSIDLYHEHLVLEREDGGHGSTKDDSLYDTRFLTNRQKRLVSYLKIYRHIWGKGVRGVRKELPACTCKVIRRWWPDDADDDDILRQIDAGEAARYVAVE